MMMNYYLLTMVMMATATSGIEPYTYGWDFGFGQQSSEQSPAHASMSEYYNPFFLLS
jgi:PKD repeat protein